MLPSGMIWIYLVAPWITGYVLGPRLSGWSGYLRAVAFNYVPFIFIPCTCHLMYATAVPRLVSRVRWPLQLLLHFTLTASVSGAVGLLILPLGIWLAHPTAGWIYPPFAATAHFVAVCGTVGTSLVIPALLVQRLRRRIRETERRTQRQRQALLEAQLQALQARTNPHFLFNSINTVASLIPEDPTLAEATLERLADLFRYALDSSTTRVVPLSRELEIVEDYLQVQAVRFGDRLSWTLDVDPELDLAAAQVPPLLLQPLVENAVQHGVAQEPRGGTIRVEVSRLDGQLICAVIDDGPGQGSTHEGSGTSLRDIQERLQLIYGPGASLDARRAEGGGYCARLTLPMAAAEAG